MEIIMQNRRVFRSLGIQEAMDILIKPRKPLATDAIHEDSGSLYEPGDGEDDEQGVFGKEAMQHLEPAFTSTLASGTKTKRVMAMEQEQPARITRQRIRDLLSTCCLIHQSQITIDAEAKYAAMNHRVHALDSKLEVEKMGSAALRSQVLDLQKKLEDHQEAVKKNEEETEKLKQQGNEIQGFLRSLFGNKFAPGDARQ